MYLHHANFMKQLRMKSTTSNGKLLLKHVKKLIDSSTLGWLTKESFMATMDYATCSFNSSIIVSIDETWYLSTNPNHSVLYELASWIPLSYWNFHMLMRLQWWIKLPLGAISDTSKRRDSRTRDIHQGGGVCFCGWEKLQQLCARTISQTFFNLPFFH